MQLRPYQADAASAMIAAWRSSSRGALVVLPTGAGKSVVIAETLRQSIELSRPDRQFLVVTHSRELVQQNADACARLCPGVPFGIVSAGLGRNDADARVLFAGIQSLRNPGAIGPRHVVLIDEAHAVSTEPGSSYGKLLAHLRARVPRLFLGGLSATPFRMSQGMLTEPHDGRPAVFDTVAFEVTLAQMIEAGYLCPVTTRATPAAFDVSGVSIRAGEFVEGELAAAVNHADVNHQVVASALRLAWNRRAWLIFAVNADHARGLSGALAEHGVAHSVVLGSTPRRERDAAIAAYRAGRIRALVSVGVLSTGFDAPNTDCLIMARPTWSLSLYVQMTGRGMRLSPGKADCLVLDFAGNTERLGPVDEVRHVLASPDENGKRAKVCQRCAEIVSLTAAMCPACSTPFPARERQPQSRTVPAPRISRSAILARDANLTWFTVDNVSARMHESFGRQSVRVVYHVREQQFPISSFFSTSGRGFWPFQRWWDQHGTRLRPPRDPQTAVYAVSELPTPTAIGCEHDGKFWRVVRLSFDRRAVRAA